MVIHGRYFICGIGLHLIRRVKIRIILSNRKSEMLIFSGIKLPSRIRLGYASYSKFFKTEVCSNTARLLVPPIASFNSTARS